MKNFSGDLGVQNEEKSPLEIETVQEMTQR